MDKMSREQRHRCMAAIRSRDTKPEMLVRRFLFSRGFRYRLYCRQLPGHPDLVLRKYRAVIFVNGCFWHGHEGCKYYRLPKTNVEFWEKKIKRNKERDVEEVRLLTEMGWSCITIWECELKPKVREQTLEYLAYRLKHLEDRKSKRLYEQSEDLAIAAEEIQEYGLKYGDEVDYD